MFDRLKSLIERGGKADTPVEAERRFIMPQAGGQGEARKQQPSSSMPRFKGSRSTDTVHARAIQSRLRMAFGASQPVSDSSEERRVGNKCVSTCITRGQP